MADNQSFGSRFQNYRASKAALFWYCVGCIVATMIVGFAWGGWVTGGTAGKMAAAAASDARAELAASICTSRFASSPDASANLAALKASDSWKREDLIEKGGWITLPGIASPVAGAADLCAKQLMDSTVPPPSAAKAG